MTKWRTLETNVHIFYLFPWLLTCFKKYYECGQLHRAAHRWDILFKIETAFFSFSVSNYYSDPFNDLIAISVAYYETKWLIKEKNHVLNN